MVISWASTGDTVLRKMPMAADVPTKKVSQQTLRERPRLPCRMRYEGFLLRNEAESPLNPAVLAQQATDSHGNFRSVFCAQSQG